MKLLFFLFLFVPLLSPAQNPVPRYENDTLYTTSGYTIYKGKTLQFGKGTGRNGRFKYVNIKSETSTAALTNNSIVVTKLKNFGISVLGNGYIEIIGTIIFKDGSKGYVDLHMAFDRAIENSPDLPTELIVPAEFRGNQKLSAAAEINRLYKLYQEGVLTKEEFEKEKKKILERE